ncbi:hypothetical protein JI739_08530 [Ramlibacter sp. AW1]|uniref:Uncharacterized protein n=1 Tax=Ramlibacter aurantiacus TaxID=2801330 RepID=A0A936ZN63_9BURK|nr:hypothetical protein [Ramlibacter aurantiacus]MBL0420385.1 hypothetical protein [Ramlibacter aurantiacus]
MLARLHIPFQQRTGHGPSTDRGDSKAATADPADVAKASASSYQATQGGRREADAKSAPATLASRRVRVSGPLSSDHGIRSRRCVEGVSRLLALGAGAGVAYGVMSVCEPDDTASTAIAGFVGGVIGIAATPFAHVAAKALSTFGFAGCAVARESLAHCHHPTPPPSEQIDRLIRLAQGHAPLTRKGMEAYLDDLHRIGHEGQEVPLQRDVVLAMARMVSAVVVPGSSDDQRKEQLTQVVRAIDRLYPYGLTGPAVMNEALLAMATHMPADTRHPERAQALAEFLLGAVRTQYHYDEGTQECRERSDFLAALCGQPHFQPVAAKLWELGEKTWPGRTIQAQASKLQNAAATVPQIQLRSRSYGDTLLTTIKVGDRSSAYGFDADLCDQLFVALALNPPGQMRQEQLATLQDAVRTSKADSAQQRALRQLAALESRRPDSKSSEPLSVSWKPDEAIWDDAPVGVRSALQTLADQNPANAGLRTLSDRTASMPAILRQLDATAPGDLAIEVRRAIRVVNPPDTPPRRQIANLVEIMGHLERRSDLPRGAFLEGLADPDALIKLIGQVKPDELTSHRDRQQLSEQLAELPRAAQLTATPELLDATSQLLASIWRGDAAGGHARVQRSHAQEYIDEARESIDRRMFPRRDPWAASGDPGRLNLPWLQSSPARPVSGQPADHVGVPIHASDFERRAPAGSAIG